MDTSAGNQQWQDVDVAADGSSAIAITGPDGSIWLWSTSATHSPTMYPTYPPPPPNLPIVALYSGGYRCGPEVVLYENVFPDQRRLEAPADNSLALAKVVPTPIPVVIEKLAETKVDEAHGMVSFPFDTYVRGLVDVQQKSDLDICYDGASDVYTLLNNLT